MKQSFRQLAKAAGMPSRAIRRAYRTGEYRAPAHLAVERMCVAWYRMIREIAEEIIADSRLATCARQIVQEADLSDALATFVCDGCGGQVERRPEGEALAEKERLFPGVPLEECAVICDECFHALGLSEHGHQ